MGLTKRIPEDHNLLVENALDEKAMETLRTLRRRTNIEEVTDQA